MSPYKRPLNPNRKEIRRLVLHPLSAGASIQCSIEIVSLFDEPRFEALSYVWGAASHKQTIILEETSFSITNNLAIALHYLRSDDEPRRLWVDAICINQDNTKERNEQVAMMGEIYAQAKPVLIWLGEASENSDHDFHLVSRIAGGAKVPDEVLENTFAFYMELVEREWFTRLWTVQELVLSNEDPIVGCGAMWTKWSSLLGVWHIVAKYEFGKLGMVSEWGDNNDGSLSTRRPNGIKIDLLNHLHEKIQKDGGEDLQKLIFSTKTSKATEPRDIIYALLGMMQKDDREQFSVDYDRPIERVFAEAIAHIFRKGNGPFLLSGMELAGAGPATEYPSWIPRFGTKFLTGPTRFHPPGTGASGVGRDCVNGSIDEDLKTLRVRGLNIDIVVDKISFDEQECLHKLPQVAELRSRAHQLEKIHSSHRSYCNGLKSKEPVWRTLIANKAYSGAARQVAPENYQEMYNMLLDEQIYGQACDRKITSDYELSLLNRLSSCCFFITATGFCGIGSLTVEEGDHLVIWFGSPVPFALRPIPRSSNKEVQAYAVVGVAYVAGVMDGEMVDEIYCEDYEDDVEFIIR